MTDDKIVIQRGQVIHPKSNSLLLTAEVRKQTSGDQWGEGRGEGQERGRGLRGTNYYV